MGSEKSNPAVGEKEKFEIAEEVRLEVVSENWKLDRLISEMKRVHPYEEPAFDIYPLANSSRNYGIGCIGSFEQPMHYDYFLEYAADRLGIQNFRYSGKRESIKTAAVCGGSGSEYTMDAVRAGADAYITADIKYHGFQEAGESILLIDAGHYETEVFALNAVERYLVKSFSNVEIIKYTDGVNPVNFFNNQGAR